MGRGTFEGGHEPVHCNVPMRERIVPITGDCVCLTQALASARALSDDNMAMRPLAKLLWSLCLFCYVVFRLIDAFLLLFCYV